MCVLFFDISFKMLKLENRTLALFFHANNNECAFLGIFFLQWPRPPHVNFVSRTIHFNGIFPQCEMLNCICLELKIVYEFIIVATGSIKRVRFGKMCTPGTHGLPKALCNKFYSSLSCIRSLVCLSVVVVVVLCWETNPRMQ